MVYLVDEETFEELPKEAKSLIGAGPSVEATAEEILGEFAEEEEPVKPMVKETDLEEFEK